MHFLMGVRKLYKNRYLHTIDITNELANFEKSDVWLAFVRVNIKVTNSDAEDFTSFGE